MINQDSETGNGEGESEFHPPLNNTRQASFQPSSSNDNIIPKSNYSNLLSTSNELGHEPLETNEPIQLINKLDSLVSDEQYEPCEDGDIHE